MAFLEEVKKKVSLKEIVEAHVALTPTGGGKYRGLSPFKNERTPSLYVDDEKKLWKDFASGKGGGILDWFVEKEGMTKREAVYYICEQYDIQPDDKNEDPNEKLRKCVKDAHVFFRKGRAKAVEHALSRGYPEEVVDKYELGFAPDSYFEIINYLKGKGHSDTTIVESGIGMWDNKNSGRVLARQRNRVMFPIKDLHGSLVGHVGRTVSDAKPKYLNPTNSPLFTKETTLFNYSNVRALIRDKGRVVVSEGPWDAVMGSYAGEPIVSTFGTSVSNYQIEVLSKVTKDIYLGMDADASGRSAMLDIFKRIEDLGLDVIVHSLSLPEGCDVADVVKDKGVEELGRLVENALPDSAFVIEALYNEAKSTSTKESAISRKVLEQMKTYFKTTTYTYRTLDILDRLSQLLNLDKRKLDAYLQSGTDFKHNSQVYKKLESMEFPGAIHERRIMTECLKDPSNIAKLKSMGITRYDIESYLVAKVLSIIDTNKQEPFVALKDELSPEEYDTVLSAYMNAESINIDIYQLGSIIVANKSKVRGASAVTNILGRRRNSLEREVTPTYQELLRRMKK